MEPDDFLVDCCVCGAALDDPADCYANGHNPVPAREYYNTKPKKETKPMNYSTAVMLFNAEIRAVKVSYEPNFPNGGAIFKTLDPDIVVGDYVTIPTNTRHNMTVARVEDVDVEIDFDDSTQIGWVVSRVPVSEYEGILKDEQQWIAEMKKAQNRKKKEDIKKNMVDMYQADGHSLETLAIAGRKPAATCIAIESEVVK